MYKNKKILGLITARGGSKRLPHKNIRPLLKKPLIGWTIEQAKKSLYIDRIIVSTDDKEIADICKGFGAEVPFLRPKRLAADTTRSIDVVTHTIKWLMSKGEAYDVLVLLQPTSPLRTPEDIDHSIELLFLKNAQVIVSVCKVHYSPYWINTLPKNGCMKDFVRQQAKNKNRRLTSSFYRLNGALYVGFCNYLLEKENFFGNRTFAYLMPEERSVDIDDKMDLLFAEFLLKNKFGLTEKGKRYV